MTSLGYVGERVTGKLLTALPSQVVREEVFRLATPFRFASRYARHPVTMGHHRFGPGDRIVLCLGTANLDPDRYPELLGFRQRKKESSLSLSFGAGPHHCPGALLARAIVTLLLNSLVTSGVHFDAAHVEREPQLPMLRYRRLDGRLTPSVRACAPASASPSRDSLHGRDRDVAIRDDQEIGEQLIKPVMGVVAADHSIIGLEDPMGAVLSSEPLIARTIAFVVLKTKVTDVEHAGATQHPAQFVDQPTLIGVGWNAGEHGNESHGIEAVVGPWQHGRIGQQCEAYRRRPLPRGVYHGRSEVHTFHATRVPAKSVIA